MEQSLHSSSGQIHLILSIPRIRRSWLVLCACNALLGSITVCMMTRRQLHTVIFCPYLGDLLCRLRRENSPRPSSPYTSSKAVSRYTDQELVVPNLDSKVKHLAACWDDFRKLLTILHWHFVHCSKAELIISQDELRMMSSTFSLQNERLHQHSRQLVTLVGEGGRSKAEGFSSRSQSTHAGKPDLAKSWLPTAGQLQRTSPHQRSQR